MTEPDSRPVPDAGARAEARRVRLSAVVITFNEERDLPACLESLRGVVDEIVIVDNRSADRTREIARRFTDKVFERSFDGYGPQKQYALDQTVGEWVLNVDADERLTPELAAELTQVTQNDSGEFDGYQIPFQLYFMGRRLRFGGAFGETHLRLFRRSKARYPRAMVHEGIQVDGRVGRLNGAIRHESYRNFAEYLDKCRRYTGFIAREKFRQGKRFRAWQHARLAWEFFVRYVVKLGWLDGSPGFTYAALSAYYAWLKHVRVVDYERGVADE
jgi:glycosyltransferase involved in cell wall biosynthesis